MDILMHNLIQHHMHLRPMELRMDILMHLHMDILMDFIMDFLMDFLIDCHIICHMDLLTVHHMEHIMLPRMCPNIMLPLMEFHMGILMDTPMPHPIMKLDPMKLRPLMELLLLTLMQLILGINPDIIQPILTDPNGYHLMVPHLTHLLMVLLPMYRHIWHLEELHPQLLTGLLMILLKGRLMEPLPQLIEPLLLGESLKIESYSLSNQMVIMQ